MKEQIQILIDGKEIEYYELEEHFKNLDCITKEDGKWFIHRKPIEDKKIETIDYIGYGEDGDLQYQIIDKINEIIDKLNEEK